MSDCASCLNSSITADCTVNDAIAKYPAAGTVLNAFGIDTCCGGTSSIGAASALARVDIATVLDALASVERHPAVPDAGAMPQASASCGCGCR